MGFLYGGHFRIFCIVEHYTTPAIRSTSLSELYEYLNMKINIQIGRSCENYTLYGSLIVADSDFLM